MRQRIVTLRAVAALLFAALLIPASGAVAAPPLGRYIVVLADGVADPAAVAADHARRFGVQPGHVYRAALRGYAAQIPAGRLAALESDPRVVFVSEDRPVFAVGQTLPTGVNRIDGELTPTGNLSGGPAVAVIDTGSGPHLELNVKGGVNCSTGRPGNFKDGDGHGTHVAGTIGAIDNADGVIGVAPGVPIYSVRVLNNAGSGTWSSVICGIDWVTANAASLGIKVANMSLGGSGSDDGNCGNTNNDALHRAICNSVAAGVTYVVAAGNSNANFATFVPAAYDEVLTVTAVADFDGAPGGGAAATCRSDVDDTAADFSNFTTADSSDAGHTIAAPGVCILSTWKGGGYNTISGTSMASPHVAGTAALCIATGGTTGKCTGGPAGVIGDLLSDAALQPAGYGFGGDPSAPIGSRYYSYLVYAGGY